MHKLKKSVLIFISLIIIIAVVVILFISPITKHFVEKYDEKYTGRQIKMDWAYVNPFSGYIHFSNLKIYELKSDSVFFSAKGISGNIAMLKLFSKTYEINEFTLDHPTATLIQNKKVFNFNDLIEKFSSKGNSDTTIAPVHLSILHVKINDGEFYYRDQLISINYFIKKVNIESTGKRWDTDTTATKFSFSSGIGSGNVKGDFTVNFKNKDYRLAVLVQKFDLTIIEQYLKDLTNYGSFRAILDANIKTTGNFNDKKDITNSGVMAINDFHFGKNPKDDYVSFDKLVVAINQVSPKEHKFFFDSISISHPYFKYERYDYLDNVQTMFGGKGSKVKAVKANPDKFNLIIEIADYMKVLSKNFFQSNYKINRLAIYKGDLKFNDYSISEKFALELYPLTVTADSIDKNHKRVDVFLKSGIKPYGNLSVAIGMNPKDSSDFDIQYHFHKISVPMFNPYIVSYSSFPLDRGTIEFNGKWNVRNGIIQSNNHLVIIDPRLTTRLKNKEIKWLPMKLLMFFIREKGNVIDYEVPITGNLKNPKFHLYDVITDILKNVFVKPASTPYRAEVKNIETEIEKSLTLKWQMRHSSLLPVQEKFIERMADFLEKNQAATIIVYPQLYEIKEKEYILFYEAKKKYYMLHNKINAKSFKEDDSAKVDKMSVKDSLFVRYLNKQINDSMIFTVQEKCARIINSSIVDSKFKQLNKERKTAFDVFFKGRGVEKQLKFSSEENVIPFNGFSFYKIEYKGEFPEPLLKAYRKMNELNDEAPRKELQKKRMENESTK